MSPCGLTTVVLVLVNGGDCTFHEQEFAILEIRYQETLFPQKSSQDLRNEETSPGLLSVIDNKTLTLMGFTSIWKHHKERTLVISKLHTGLDVRDFLFKVAGVQHLFITAVSFMSVDLFQSLVSQLSNLLDYDLSSSLYICTFQEYQMENMSSLQLVNSASKCYELYSIKEQSILKSIPPLPNQPYDLEWLVNNQVSRRGNFFKTPIIAGAIKYRISKHLNQYETRLGTTNLIEFRSGLEVEILRCLQDLLNFTEVGMESEAFLVEGINNTLDNSGAAKLLNEGFTDIHISPAEYIPYRMDGPYGIRYLHPTYRSTLLAFFIQPHINKVRNIFYMPFTWDLWLTSGVFTVFIGSVIWTISFIVAKQNQRLKQGDLLALSRIHCNSVWIIASINSIINQRGHYKITERIKSVKIIILVTLLASQIMYAGYTSAMCSILSVEVVPIKQFENLEAVNFRIYMDKFVPTLKTRIMWLKANKLLPPISITEMTKNDSIPLILTSQSALITTADEFYPTFDILNISEKVACGISQVPLDRSFIKGGMFVKQGSPFRDFFNTKLLLLRERGLQSRYLTTYFQDSTLRCLDLHHSIFNSVGFQDVVTGFGFLLLAFAVTILLLAVEVYAYRRLNIFVYYW